ncbi:hypothetical protein [Alicyclobacillus fastidiosus]|uniref:Uncharacterized protein n=1 Tax=Alicyclobacillus fastidiosus TaxID=392011 RepID=A0ABV5ALB3_9BACL|nr:hypothetical protein [Alicyclobacillus fastidiosus]WEH08414.1 hypothetical protein PYS47_17185 [Alicyclobacillus fastidiosus]
MSAKAKPCLKRGELQHAKALDDAGGLNEHGALEFGIMTGLQVVRNVPRFNGIFAAYSGDLRQ